MQITSYDTGGWYDEVFDPSGQPRPEAQLLLDIIHSQPEGEFERLQETANAALVNLGITFNVYSDGAGIERVLPFDIFPRVVRNDEWDDIERGLKQRIYALNLSCRTSTTTRRSCATASCHGSWCCRRRHTGRRAAA